LIIATAGHVDHGKTSLVRALTGVDTDRLAEEKRRGLTIDLGFAYVDLDNGRRLGFVDVPGHQRFVSNMVAGVTGVDAALIVVAADDGVMPQTEEHIAILDLLGIDRGVIAVTKSDKVDEGRLAEVAASIRECLRESTMARFPVLYSSVETGAGIAEIMAEFSADTAQIPQDGQRFRLAVDRSFVIDGAGVILAGPVLSGRCEVGDELFVMPAGVSVSMRGLRVQDRDQQSAGVGDRCAIQIGGRNAGRHVARRGDWLCAPETGIASRRIDVKIRSARTVDTNIRHDLPVHVHIGAADVPGRLALLDRRQLTPGEEAWGQVVLSRDICAVRGDRFILRDQSAITTIAGGWIVDVPGAERGRARPERLRVLNALAIPAPKMALEELLALTNGAVHLENLTRRWNLLPDTALKEWNAVDLVRIGDLAFGTELWRAWRRTVLATLDTAHREHPERLGLDALRLAAVLRIRHQEARLVLAELVEEGGAVCEFGTYHLPDHQPRLASVDQAAWEAMRIHLGTAEIPAEVAHQIARKIDAEPAELLKLFGRLEARGLLIRVSRNRFLLPETVSFLARAADEVASQNPEGITIADFRESTKIGRNLAVEFLEFLDRKRMTRRAGSLRILIAGAADVFGI
jgi:selenocysteine-specific elongation factor